MAAQESTKLAATDPAARPGGRLAGRRAVVTGGASGIGLAVARRFVAEGARVAVIDNDRAAVDALKPPTDGAVPLPAGSWLSLAADVADAVAIESAVARAADTFGGLDLLVNSAGVVRDAWVTKLSEADWDRVVDVNLKGTFLACRAALARMGPGGAIVNVASRAWLGNPGQANYAAAKGGVVSLTRTLALEVVRRGIRVNAVAPGLVDTPLTRALPEEVRARLIAQQPDGRMGRPEEVASAILFLASDEASFINGQILHVCGGKSLGIEFCG